MNRKETRRKHICRKKWRVSKRISIWVNVKDLFKVLCFHLCLSICVWRIFQTTTDWGFPGGSDGKRTCLQWGRPKFDPWVRKILWRREQLPTPIFLPKEPGGLQSMRSKTVGHDWLTVLKQVTVGTSLAIQWLRLCLYCWGHRFDPWSEN